MRNLPPGRTYGSRARPLEGYCHAAKQGSVSWFVIGYPGSKGHYLLRLANGLLCCTCAGISALTTLSRLTRLALQGDWLGIGIGELATEVITPSKTSCAAGVCVLMSSQLAAAWHKPSSGCTRALDPQQNSATASAQICLRQGL